MYLLKVDADDVGADADASFLLEKEVDLAIQEEKEVATSRISLKQTETIGAGNCCVIPLINVNICICKKSMYINNLDYD